MKKFAFACVLLTAILSAPLEAKGCSLPPQGPPGPPGPPGPEGPAGGLTKNYASSFAYEGDGFQTIQQGTEHLPISFPRERLRAVGVTHPVENDSSSFKIHDKGIYLIGWTIKASNTTPCRVTINLIINGQPAQPIPFQEMEMPLSDSTITLSGQTLIPLKAGSTLQLGVSNDNGLLSISVPSLHIMQVAQ